MKKLLLILFLQIILFLAWLLFFISISWGSEWSSSDTLYQASYSALHVVDWGQTRFVAKHPDKFHEKNPILGRHPSVGKVDTYFFSTLVGHAIISYALPQPYRKWWQRTWIVIETGMVINNYRIGVKVDF